MRCDVMRYVMSPVHVGPSFLCDCVALDPSAAGAAAGAAPVRAATPDTATSPQIKQTDTGKQPCARARALHPALHPVCAGARCCLFPWLTFLARVLCCRDCEAMGGGSGDGSGDRRRYHATNNTRWRGGGDGGTTHSFHRILPRCLPRRLVLVCVFRVWRDVCVCHVHARLLSA